MGAALLVSSLGVASCTSGDDSGLPQYTAAPLPSGASASSSTSAPPASSTTTITSATSAAARLEGADLVTVGMAAPPAKDAAAAFHGYVEFWQADLAALTRSDPTWKPLLDRVSGQQRKDTLALLTSNRDKKQKITGTITIKPQVLAIRGTTGLLRDCVDLSRSKAVDAAGRTVAGTQGGAAVAYAVTMTLVGSRWTVSNLDSIKDATCR